MKALKQLKWLLERALHLGGYGCSDTERLLFEYVEGGLPERTRHRLDFHLASCRSCVRYVKTYRQTVQLARRHGLPEMAIPAELQVRLKEFVAQSPQLR